MIKGLDTLGIGELGRVVEIRHDAPMTRRLEDLGFTPGALVECTLMRQNAMHAFLIRGSTIALRERDCRQILIEPREVNDLERHQHP